MKGIQDLIPIVLDGPLPTRHGQEWLDTLVKTLVSAGVGLALARQIIRILQGECGWPTQGSDPLGDILRNRADGGN